MNKKLLALRLLMKKQGIHAYLVPSTDPHQSEYLPEFWKRRQYVTGFTGSAGDALVTLTKAGLWVDSRYYLQAEREVQGSGFIVFRSGTPGVQTWQEWIAKELRRGQALGLDAQLITRQNYLKLKDELGRRDIGLKCIERNLVDEIWAERPAPPSAAVMLLEEKYAGEDAGSKLERLRKKITEEGADAHVLTQLDAIAWLFNIRGSDAEFNPVAIAYAIITRKRAMLFIDKTKISKDTGRALAKTAKVHAYEDFSGQLRLLAEQKMRVWLDETSVSQWVVSRLARGARLVLKPSPVTLFKAIKNRTEINGSKAAHLRDGVAMVKFIIWLKKAVPKGGVSELSAAKKLAELRSQQPLYQGLSFRTISSYAGHGAVVHYAVSPETDIPLRPEGIYVIDSGSQYLDATTDITRTVCLGSPTDEQRDRFTRVLKGLIRLTSATFPQGTAGPQLDILARLALWEAGLNYGHGTGHGIGAFLNVHEGPQSIAPVRGFGIAFEPGMITSAEPGFYKENEYGFRVENLVLVIKDEKRSTESLSYYAFETLTRCPIELDLIKKEMLTAVEVEWLNSYHLQVREALLPHLAAKEASWLEKSTQPI